jgi:signal transduction histidine kinase
VPRTSPNVGPLRYVIWPAGVALGVAAAWVGRPELVALDTLTGFALFACGLAAWSRRPQCWAAGLLMAVAGLAWFLGSLVPWAIYLHRGFLAHLLLSYPGGRLWPLSPLDRAAVVAAYAYASVYPVARNDYATIAFALGLIALASRRYVVAGGPQRRARLAALIAATGFGLAVVLGVVVRLADAGGDRAVLWVYDLTVCALAVGLSADLLRGRWAQATVTGLVVDLGEPAMTGTLRDRLARTLGDPTLVVGYRLPEQSRYVDEAGQPVELPDADAQRTVTPILDDGRRVAVLVHDVALLEDPALVSAVAAATRLAVSNARLQAEVRERMLEVEASRRRIVGAADEQRVRLGHELHIGTERRLSRVAELVGRIDPELDRQLEATRRELAELARGIQPQRLTVDGLAAAIRELAERSSFAVAVEVSSRRFPAAVESAAYFVCSEALANVAKHARAARASIRIGTEDGLLTIEVTDDGAGGADRSGGSGLRGLADRVESLGGQLRVESPLGGGTRVTARLPNPSSSTAA